MVRTKYSHLTKGELAIAAESAAGKSEIIRELVNRLIPNYPVPAAHVGKGSHTCPVCEAELKVFDLGAEAA